MLIVPFAPPPYPLAAYEGASSPDAAGASDTQVAREGASCYREGDAERVDRRAIAIAAGAVLVSGAARTACAADGLVAGERAVGDGQARAGVGVDRATITVTAGAIDGRSPPASSRGTLRQIIREAAGRHREYADVGDLHGASLGRVAGIYADRPVLDQRIADKRERPALIEDAAAVLGVAAADGQSGDRDGNRGRGDVEDPARSARVHIDEAGPRPVDGQVLADRQLAAGQVDGLAVEARRERDQLAGQRRGDGGAERPRSAVGATRHRHRTEDQSAFERLQSRCEPPSTPTYRRADPRNTIQSERRLVSMHRWILLIGERFEVARRDELMIEIRAHGERHAAEAAPEE